MTKPALAVLFLGIGVFVVGPGIAALSWAFGAYMVERTKRT